MPHSSQVFFLCSVAWSVRLCVPALCRAVCVQDAPHLELEEGAPPALGLLGRELDESNVNFPNAGHGHGFLRRSAFG